MVTEKIMISAIWLKDETIEMTHYPTNVDCGIFVTGYRHCDCFDIISNIFTIQEMTLLRREGQIIQGFLTTKKRFVDRIEAKEIATRENQLLKTCSFGKELYSEDVWLIND